VVHPANKKVLLGGGKRNQVALINEFNCANTMVLTHLLSPAGGEAIKDPVFNIRDVVVGC
jgi:hypothetical protein